MTDSLDQHYSDDQYPSDLVAEHAAILEHGEPEGPPIRLRGPREPAPTRAQVKRFQRQSQLRRSRHLNVVRVRLQRIGARRTPRQPRTRSSAVRTRTSTSARSSPPEPPSCAGAHEHPGDDGGAS